VRRLVENGSLLTGPYYCQPDWQITGGEALLRNLVYGLQDVRKPGRHTSTGWLVDTFGHISPIAPDPPHGGNRAGLRVAGRT
jgi:mannosylglycerate hydrolase